MKIHTLQAVSCGIMDYAFLFIDVDGYCVGGVDQRKIVSARAEGYRARELGWAFFADSVCHSGSIYFFDMAIGPIRADDKGVQHVRLHVHGLPINPSRETFGGEIVSCSARLLDTIRALYDVFAGATQCPVVIVHKGGNEGLWASRALPHVPDLPIVDLGAHGCPKVDELDPLLLLDTVRCPFHTIGQKKKLVHCPRLEVWLLAAWVSRGMS
jgi:hypothetical protein